MECRADRRLAKDSDDDDTRKSRRRRTANGKNGKSGGRVITNESVEGIARLKAIAESRIQEETNYRPLRAEVRNFVEQFFNYEPGQRDRESLDTTPDGLHDKGRLGWIMTPTPFGCPVFVVWRWVGVVVSVRKYPS